MSIGARVKGIIDGKGLTPAAVAKAVEIDSSQFYRMLKGDSAWTQENLATVAGYLEVPTSYLLSFDIPVIGFVSAGEPFNYAAAEQPGDGWERVPMPPGVPDNLANKLYAVKVRGNSMEPAFKEGDIIYAKKHSRSQICNSQFVVFADQDGNAWVKKAYFSDNLVHLKSLNPAYPDIIKPGHEIYILDCVIFAKFS